MSSTFASLSNRNYRIWFLGGLVSNVGGWMARTAQAWLVLVILTDGNAQALGYQTAMVFLPGLLLTPVVGTVADRFPKRRILMVCQLVGMTSAVLLTVLTLSGHVQLWHVYALSLLEGIAIVVGEHRAGVDDPARAVGVGHLDRARPPAGTADSSAACARCAAAPT